MADASENPEGGSLRVVIHAARHLVPNTTKAAKAAAKPPKQSEGEATKPTRKRRRRETKEELAILYAQFYDRIPASANAEQMATEFADKELRVIMSTNGVLINDFNEANLKLALNLEYRFPIVGDIKGALFADAGNIWNVFDNQDNEEAILAPGRAGIFLPNRAQ